MVIWKHRKVTKSWFSKYSIVKKLISTTFLFNFYVAVVRHALHWQKRYLEFRQKDPDFDFNLKLHNYVASSKNPKTVTDQESSQSGLRLTYPWTKQRLKALVRNNLLKIVERSLPSNNALVHDQNDVSQWPIEEWIKSFVCQVVGGVKC